LRILISSLATGRFYTATLVSGIITSSRRSLLLSRPPLDQHPINAGLLAAGTSLRW
jgi:hypothetical protein